MQGVTYQVSRVDTKHVHSPYRILRARSCQPWWYSKNQFLSYYQVVRHFPPLPYTQASETRQLCGGEAMTSSHVLEGARTQPAFGVECRVLGEVTTLHTTAGSRSPSEPVRSLAEQRDAVIAGYVRINRSCHKIWQDM